MRLARYTFPVDLGNGWKLRADPGSGPGEYVFTLTGGRASASLSFALERGHCSDDAETPIPRRILLRLDKIADDLTNADLF
jgi:hypothetical protein